MLSEAAGSADSVHRSPASSDAERALSREDALTRLPNTRAFYERADVLLALARRSGLPFTIAYVDLDNFKAVNDRWGHEAGDRALRAGSA